MWVDGGARGNPGPAAVGYRIEDDAGEVLDEAGEVIGIATNNEAEYRALITALAAGRRRWGRARSRCGRTPSSWCAR